VLNIL